ncbi:50S ribosomal protein L11 methyltransferase [bacterium SCSIO 12643]|nr:50S ribosomal protein L11 methyltransferase [bacterium SCSIO 12643]
MQYTEVKFSIEPYEPWADVLSAELGEIGFESFIEEDGFLLAYVDESLFSEDALKNVDTMKMDDVEVSYSTKVLEQQNWNKEWESNFDPVYVDDQICVRATFHQPEPQYPYEIIIDPKMSFGTGHHATTHLMLSQMQSVDFKGESVLDMGSGTGVLAIFAAMRGANPVYAIDIDEWCSINARENAERNGVEFIEIMHGGKEKIPGMKVDVILANINRNILLDQLELYATALNDHGILHMSGFYQEDVESLLNEAIKYGLKFISQKSRGYWTTINLVKE